VQEAGLLSDLALRSKGHWGYPADFLEACRAELTISETYITSSPVFILEEGESIVGFYGLRAEGSELELLYLFVEPSAMNRGHGKRLWTHAVEVASKLGFQKITIESDPYAEAFYQAMGARRIGETPSSLQVGRRLPVLEFLVDSPNLI
jgi:N-acetylglutamate synthase-like GNAT family acetyltransferase